MKILALQLKRIGDLILTTPALRHLHRAWPEAHITLGVMSGTAALLPAIPHAQGAIVFGQGRGFAPWQQAFTGGWDLCFDFTGNDRSALATGLSRASQRVGFEWMRKNKLRALAYSTWSSSQVRDVHTTQHYLDLVTRVAPETTVTPDDLLPELALPASETTSEPYVLLHPGTARPEKYWLADRWSAVDAHLRELHGLKTVFTSGPDSFERAHVAQATATYQTPPDLMALATLVAGARLVISCDTAVVHLASAFRIPQIAIFGPTNPFHWRPQHDRAIVLSAAQPDAPLAKFTSRIKGAPTDRISTTTVIRAIDSLLASPR